MKPARMPKRREWTAMSMGLLALAAAGCSLFDKPHAAGQPSNSAASTPPPAANRPVSAESPDSSDDPTQRRIAEYIKQFDARDTAASRPATEQPPAAADPRTVQSPPTTHATNSDSPSRQPPPSAAASQPTARPAAKIAVAPSSVDTVASPTNDAETQSRRAADEYPAEGSTTTPMLASPRLASLSVRPAPPAPADATTRRIGANGSGGSNANVSTDRRVEALERAAASDPNDLEAQFRLRLHYLSLGQDTRATAPSPGMSKDNEQILLGMIRALQAARSRPGRDPAEWANRQLAALDDLRTLVRQRADLRVPRVALCRSVSSFGVYEEYTPAEFAAGRATPALVYVEAGNFRVEPTPTGEHRTRLSIRVAILDRNGQEVWSRPADEVEDVSRNAREDFFVPIEIEIPGVLNPGEYTLKTTVTDLIGRKSNENQVAFRVVAR